MNFEDAQQLWREQPTRAPVDASSDVVVLARVRENSARFERNSLHSDLVLIFVYSLAGIAFIWFAYVDGKPVRALSAAILLAVPIYVTAFRTRNRLFSISGDVFLTDVVAHALSGLRRRRRFLKTAFWVWWSLTCLSRLIAGVDRHIHHPSAEQTMFSLQEAAVFLLLGLGGFIGNRREIRTRLDPQIADLEAQQRTLLSATGSSP